MLNVIIVLTTLSVAIFLAFSKRLGKSSDWQATVTPLASIMGSGFLVCAPLLAGSVGNLAVFCMMPLLVLAYLLGSVIRFNIKYFEPIENSGKGPAQTMAFTSRLVLAGAYFTSVTYYLQLLAAFLLNAFGIMSELYVNLITSILLLGIGSVGMWRGLEMLEKVEKYAISLNLGAIFALILSLLIYNCKLVIEGQWQLPAISSNIDLYDLRMLLGLLIVVQGFETSRYLGERHSAEQRIRTMRNAQIISAGIYVLFLGLVSVLFLDGLGSNVTAIIPMIKPVAFVLPFLISLTAIGSQFSAAVADNSGAGGLIEDITHNKIPVRYAYLLILLVTLLLTWKTNVYEIITYASQAFALYYMFQCIVALFVLRSVSGIKYKHAKNSLFGLLAVICGVVVAFGIPSG